MPQAEWKRTRKQARREYSRQLERAKRRATYGPAMRPGRVTIRRLEPDAIAQDVARGPRPTNLLHRLAREAGHADYAHYLHSPAWRQLRSHVLERDRWRCRQCGSPESLNVHHVRYGPLDATPLGWLMTLCDSCHRALHHRSRRVGGQRG
jgi:hypothetical protein